MRLLVLCPHFKPDTAPTGVVMTQIVDELTKLGWDVDVVTALPWYRQHAIEPGWTGRLRRRVTTPWGSITRLHPFPADKANLVGRAAAFVGFSIIAAIDAATRRERPDVVLVMSPPLTLGLSGWAAAGRFGIPFVLNLQDVFPSAAVAVGAISNERAISVFEALERFCYERAAAITVLSDELAAGIERRNSESQSTRRFTTPVHVIPNFADVEGIRPESSLNDYRRRHDLVDKLVVMYAGNVGHSQDFDLLLGAAEELRARDDIVFVVNGEGVQRAPLEAAAAHLGNVRFVDYQPAHKLSETLAAADIHLVLLKPGLSEVSVPSKLYSVMAAGRAVVACVDPESEIDRLVRQANAGLSVGHDSQALAAAIRDLADDPVRRKRLATNARSRMETWPTVADVAARYSTLLDGVARHHYAGFGR